MRETFPVCCASTEEQGARSMEHRAKTMAPSAVALLISDF